MSEQRREYKRNWYLQNKERIDLRQQTRKREQLAYHVGEAFRGRKSIPIKIRRAVIKRAKEKCEGKDPHTCKGRLGIHHIDGDPDNNELSNLLLQCYSYHAKNEHGLGTKIRGRKRDEKGKFIALCL